MARDRTVIRFADPDPMRRALYLRGDFGPMVPNGGALRRAAADSSEIVAMSLAAYNMLILPQELRPALLRHESPKVRVIAGRSQTVTSREIDSMVRDPDMRVRFQAAQRHTLDEWQIGVLLRSNELEIPTMVALRQRLTIAQSRLVEENKSVQMLLGYAKEGRYDFAIANEITKVHTELYETLALARRAVLEG